MNPSLRGQNVFNAGITASFALADFPAYRKSDCRRRDSLPRLPGPQLLRAACRYASSLLSAIFISGIVTTSTTQASPTPAPSSTKWTVMKGELQVEPGAGEGAGRAVSSAR